MWVFCATERTVVRVRDSHQIDLYDEIRCVNRLFNTYKYIVFFSFLFFSIVCHLFVRIFCVWYFFLFSYAYFVYWHGGINFFSPMSFLVYFFWQSDQKKLFFSCTHEITVWLTCSISLYMRALFFGIRYFWIPHFRCYWCFYCCHLFIIVITIIVLVIAMRTHFFLWENNGILFLAVAPKTERWREDKTKCARIHKHKFLVGFLVCLTTFSAVFIPCLCSIGI